MAKPADRRHDACREAANQRVAAPCELAVIRQTFGQPHRDTSTQRGRRANQECLPGAAGGEGRREQWRQRRNRAIHKSDQAGLDDLQQEKPALGLTLLDLGVRRQMLEAQLDGERLVAFFGLGQFVEEFFDQRILAALGRLLVEAVVLKFDHLGALPHLLDVHLADGPGRLVLDEAIDIAAPDEGHEIAKFLLIEIGQPAPVIMLFFRHFHEDLGGGRIGVHQRMGKAAVSAGIVILTRNGEGQNFLFGKVGKAFQCRRCLFMVRDSP